MIKTTRWIIFLYRMHGNGLARLLGTFRRDFRVGTLRDTTYFLGGGCEQDWKFLCWGDSAAFLYCSSEGVNHREIGSS